jgi:hypothetical protein
MFTLRVALLGAALLSVAACDSDSPGGGGGDGGTVIDAGPGDIDSGGAECTPACGGDTPFCDDGTCVACTSNEQCPSDAPLCNFGECREGCAGEAVSADFVTRPPDIIWVVDQSGSMDQETSHVQSQINSFVSIIDASGIDYRVVMIADPDADNAICVSPPLGGPNCGDNTRFRLVPREVRSHDGPQAVIDEYAEYSDFLRAESLKHIVFVTDDDSDMSAAEFTSEVLDLQPAGSFDDFRVHGIYAFGNGEDNGCEGTFGEGAADGTVYTELIDATGGAAGVICTGNWDQVFADIQESVIDGSQVACTLAVPPPPDGQNLDPGNVDVRYLAGGVGPGESLDRVDDAASCVADGWYYDVPTAPTQIILCPATCSEVQNDVEASVQVEVGCGNGPIGKPATL